MRQGHGGGLRSAIRMGASQSSLPGVPPTLREAREGEWTFRFREEKGHEPEYLSASLLEEVVYNSQPRYLRHA